MLNKRLRDRLSAVEALVSGVSSNHVRQGYLLTVPRLLLSFTLSVSL